MSKSIEYKAGKRHMDKLVAEVSVATRQHCTDRHQARRVQTAIIPLLAEHIGDSRPKLFSKALGQKLKSFPLPAYKRRQLTAGILCGMANFQLAATETRLSS